MAFRSIPFLLIIIIGGFLQDLPAQEWAPVGSRWYYSQYYFNPNIGLKTIDVVGDTVIKDRACRIFAGGESCSLSFQFAYREDRRIYYFNEQTQDFQLLYDFNLVAGDTLKMFVADEWSPDDTAYLKIDSVGQTYLNEDTLQVQHVTYLFDLNPNLSFGNKIYEDIGGNDFFLPTYGVCDIPAGPLRCFEHPNLGLYQLLTDFSCDYVPVREEEVGLSFTLYPNPTNDQLSISSPDTPFLQLDIPDLNGLRIQTFDQIRQMQYNLPVADLPAGLYLLKAHFQNGTVILRRFVKN